MIAGFSVLFACLTAGPIAWRYSQRPENEKKWLIAGYLSLCIVALLRLVAAHAHAGVAMILLGTPLAMCSLAILIACGIRGLKRRAPLAAGLSALGAVASVAIVAPFLG